MSPHEIAQFVLCLRYEVHEMFEAYGLEQEDADQTLAEFVACVLAEHVRDNQSYYEARRPVSADDLAASLKASATPVDTP